MNQTTTSTKHCQICARDIKANTGRIAHHGYSRPGYGYQTASCFGAQELPYEQSRDAIGRYLVRLQDYRQSQETYLADITTEAPAEITVHARYSYQEDVTYERPADFDTINYYGSMPHTYANAYGHLVRDTERNIKAVRQEIAFLQARYDTWVKVEG